jgi:hypothetical protein
MKPHSKQQRLPKLGERLHIGKETVMGLSRYQLSA